MRDWYSQDELDELVGTSAPREGWDFSGMTALRQPVPWEYMPRSTCKR
jgi:hypothetical protein